MGDFFRRCQDLDSSRFVKLPGASELILFYWQKVIEATKDLSLIEGMSHAGF